MRVYNLPSNKHLTTLALAYEQNLGQPSISCSSKVAPSFWKRDDETHPRTFGDEGSTGPASGRLFYTIALRHGATGQYEIRLYEWLLPKVPETGSEATPPIRPVGRAMLDQYDQYISSGKGIILFQQLEDSFMVIYRVHVSKPGDSKSKKFGICVFRPDEYGGSKSERSGFFTIAHDQDWDSRWKVFVCPYRARLVVLASNDILVYDMAMDD